MRLWSIVVYMNHGLSSKILNILRLERGKEK